jgi:hypothetical protein
MFPPSRRSEGVHADSFGFDDNTNSDALFEILYHELDEEDGTLQSSIDLNPYSPKDFVSQGKCSSLEQISLPLSIKEIGSFAFF